MTPRATASVAPDSTHAREGLPPRPVDDVAPRRRRKTQLRRRVGLLALELWLPVTLLVVWWALTRDGGSVFFPPPEKIWESFEANWLFERIGSDLVPTLVAYVGGMAIASVGGIAIGLGLGLWPFGRRCATPTLDFLRSIPGPAVVSILIVLIGFGRPMAITAVAFAAIFPILLNTIDGVRSVNEVQLDVATAYRLGTKERILAVMLPSASPQIFAGLRISIAVGLAVLVFAEMLSGGVGVGYFILFAEQTFKIPDMWSGIMVLGLLGLSINALFVVVERHVMAWHRGWRATARADEGGA